MLMYNVQQRDDRSHPTVQQHECMCCAVDADIYKYIQPMHTIRLGGNVSASLHKFELIANGLIQWIGRNSGWETSNQIILIELLKANSQDI